MKNQREQMVYELKHKYGITSTDILFVMLQVPRHKFVEASFQDIAYFDDPVPIGFGQTMSQPYTVAFMTELLDLTGKEKVLEIGTGSGYQAAVLSKLAGSIYSVEIIPDLTIRARSVLKRLGYKNVSVKTGSGEWGWKEKSPFDAIIVTAGIKSQIPEELFNQLNTGGVMVAPIGEKNEKKMIRLTKKRGLSYKDLKDIGSLKKKGVWEEFGTFRFVPFIEEKRN